MVVLERFRRERGASCPRCSTRTSPRCWTPATRRPALARARVRRAARSWSTPAPRSSCSARATGGSFCPFRAVQHAHAQLVIHRDIKPANVLVDGKWQRQAARPLWPSCWTMKQRHCAHPRRRLQPSHPVRQPRVNRRSPARRRRQRRVMHWRLALRELLTITAPTSCRVAAWPRWSKPCWRSPGGVAQLDGWQTLSLRAATSTPLRSRPALSLRSATPPPRPWRQDIERHLASVLHPGQAGWTGPAPRKLMGGGAPPPRAIRSSWRWRWALASPCGRPMRRGRKRHAPRPQRSSRCCRRPTPKAGRRVNRIIGSTAGPECRPY